MLRVAARAPQAMALALAGYNLAVALWGWPHPRPAPPGPRRRQLRVVIPAHDEEAVIGGLLADLAAQDYAPAEVWVLADRCRDTTVAVAVAAGARVDERHAGRPGKGALLAWHLERHPLAADEALVVFDADNRLPPGVLARLADELDAGGQVLQAYLDVVDPDVSAVATASALSYWAGNRMVQLARRNLGWSADLGGTGMCLTAEALAAAGGFGSSLAEDQELAARLALAGIQVVWLHDVRVRDDKPQAVGVALHQRARWMAGKRAVARRYAGRLLARRTPAAFDVALRLVQPGRTFMVLVMTAVGGAAALTASPYLFAARLWAGAVAVQVLAPLPFLARDGVPARYLLRYPLLALFGLIWVPARVLSRRVRGWYHTPHRAREA